MIRNTFNLLLGNEHEGFFDLPMKLIHSILTKLQVVCRANSWQIKY